MVSSSIKIVKGSDGEDTIVFTRPSTKPDFSIPRRFPGCRYRAWHFWLCDGYGDSPFVYCSYGLRDAKVIQLNDLSGLVNVLVLGDSGCINKTITTRQDTSVVHKEAVKLITEEIIRRTLLGT